MTSKEAADLLGVDRATVHAYRLKGWLPATETCLPGNAIETRYDFSPVDVKAFMLTFERWGGPEKKGWRPRQEPPAKQDGLPPEIEKQAELLWAFIEPRLRETIRASIVEAFS